MQFDQFLSSVRDALPVSGLSLHLAALWWDAKGDWEKSHELIQDEPDAFSARIHAYLHRKEGDKFNADYWYRRAGTRQPALTLPQEWEWLVKEALGN